MELRNTILIRARSDVGNSNSSSYCYSKSQICSPIPTKNKGAILWNNLSEGDICDYRLTKCDSDSHIFQKNHSPFEPKFRGYSNIRLRYPKMASQESFLEQAIEESIPGSLRDSDFNSMNNVCIDVSCENNNDDQKNNSIKDSDDDSMVFPPRASNPIIHDEHFSMRPNSQMNKLLSI